jgi:GDP-mannose 6-dehydrogenase
MQVAVFGLGYVGCVTAACFARAGHRVIGVDVSHEKVDLINAGRSPIVEPGLGELVSTMVASGRLRATTDVADAVSNACVALICVGTPSAVHGRPDVSAIDRVGQQIGAALQPTAQPFTVVLRSTVLPGTTESVLLRALQAGIAGRPGIRVRLAMNPEFMREGSSLADFDEPPMVLVGTDDPSVAALVRSMYVGVRAPFIQTTLRTAELVKFACNAFHALKVCFANEVADVAQALGADGAEVMRVFAIDKKLNVSPAYLKPGFAFGGSCLPKDLRALNWVARTHDLDTPVLASVLPSNQLQVQAAVDRILSYRRKRIAVVGLAFKPTTDDLRESPVVKVVEALIGKGCDLRILDKNVSLAKLTGANRRYIETEVPHIASLLCDNVGDLVAHGDILVIGSPTAEAAQAVAAARPDCAVVDLTRGSVKPAARAIEERATWVQEAAS